MGKGTELLQQFSEQPLSPEKPSRPRLRLKGEATVEASNTTGIQGALAALSRNELRNFVIRDQTTGIEAVAVPIERYVDLIGTELESSNSLAVAGDGRLGPTGLAESEVEEVDEAGSWVGRAPKA